MRYRHFYIAALAFVLPVFLGCATGGAYNGSDSTNDVQVEEYEEKIALFVHNESTESVTIGILRYGSALDCARTPNLASSVTSYTVDERDITNRAVHSNSSFVLVAKFPGDRCVFTQPITGGALEKGTALIVNVERRPVTTSDPEMLQYSIHDYEDARKILELDR